MKLDGLTYERDGHRRFIKRSWYDGCSGHAYIGKGDRLLYIDNRLSDSSDYNEFRAYDDWVEVPPPSVIQIGGE